MEQIDFEKLFGRKTYEPLNYRVRFDGNRSHDVAFLDGYLHDATLFLDQIKLEKRKLCIPLERICWEIFDGACAQGTHGCRSELCFFPVTNYYFYVSYSLLRRMRLPKRISIRDFTLKDNGRIIEAELSLSIPGSSGSSGTEFRLSIELKGSARQAVVLTDCAATYA